MNQYQEFMRQVKPVPHCNDALNYEACKRCAENGFVCCQRLPCSISPEEIIDLSFQGICNLIDTGLVSLDWWVGDVNDENGDTVTIMDVLSGNRVNKHTDIKSFFLRMRGKGDPVVHPALLPSVCIAWDKDGGCKFPYIYRPKGGRGLLPPNCKANPSEECKETYSKLQGAKDWVPYKDILQQVCDKYGVIANDETYMFAEVTKLFTAKGEERKLMESFFHE